MTLQCPANFLHFLESENIGSPDGDPISSLFQITGSERLPKVNMSFLVNMSFIAYQIQKLVPQRIMVKTTWKSDRPWSAIFNVIVYHTFWLSYKCAWPRNSRSMNLNCSKCFSYVNLFINNKVRPPVAMMYTVKCTGAGITIPYTACRNHRTFLSFFRTQ